MNTLTPTRTTAIYGLKCLGMAGVVAFLFAGEARATEKWETLQAIHMVENPHDSTRPGRFGELGAYQFRRETWRMYTTRPFSDANIRERSDEVAVRHYDYIKATLEQNGFAANTYNIAVAWNAGVGAVIGRDAPRASRDYASRVSNLAEEIHASVARQAAASTVAAKTPSRAGTPSSSYVILGGTSDSVVLRENSSNAFVLPGGIPPKLVLNGEPLLVLSFDR